MANQMPLKHQLGWGVERCFLGLIIAFLSPFFFLCQKTGTSSMLVFLSSWLLFSRSWRFKNCPAANKPLIVFWIQIQIQLLILKKCSWKRLTGVLRKMSHDGLATIAFGKSLNTFQKANFPVQVPGWTQFTTLPFWQLCLCCVMNAQCTSHCLCLLFIPPLLLMTLIKLNVKQMKVGE